MRHGVSAGIRLCLVMVVGILVGVCLWTAATGYGAVTGAQTDAGEESGADAHQSMMVRLAYRCLFFLALSAPIGFTVGAVAGVKEVAPGTVRRLAFGAMIGALEGGLCWGVLYACFANRALGEGEIRMRPSEGFVLGLVSGVLPGIVCGLLSAALAGVSRISVFKAMCWAALAVGAAGLIDAMRHRAIRSDFPRNSTK